MAGTLATNMNMLVNQLLPAEVVGTVAQGKVGDFSDRAGVFSGSIDQEFATFAGGFGAVAGVGYGLPLMKDAALGHDSFNGWTYFAGVRVYF